MRAKLIVNHFFRIRDIVTTGIGSFSGASDNLIRKRAVCRNQGDILIQLRCISFRIGGSCEKDIVEPAGSGDTWCVEFLYDPYFYLVLARSERHGIQNIVRIPSVSDNKVYNRYRINLCDRFQIRNIIGSDSGNSLHPCRDNCIGDRFEILTCEPCICLYVDIGNQSNVTAQDQVLFQCGYLFTCIDCVCRKTDIILQELAICMFTYHYRYTYIGSVLIAGSCVDRRIMHDNRDIIFRKTDVPTDIMETKCAGDPVRGQTVSGRYFFAGRCLIIAHVGKNSDFAITVKIVSACNRSRDSPIFDFQ